MPDLDHQRVMRPAIALTAQCSGLPFGAVIVHRDRGEIVAEGGNKSSVTGSWHGEINALNRLAESCGLDSGTRLILSTTAEPCPMCQAAILPPEGAAAAPAAGDACPMNRCLD